MRRAFSPSKCQPYDEAPGHVRPAQPHLVALVLARQHTLRPETGANEEALGPAEQPVVVRHDADRWAVEHRPIDGIRACDTVSKVAGGKPDGKAAEHDLAGIIPDLEVCARKPI